MDDDQLKRAKEAKDGGEGIHIPLAMNGIVPIYNVNGLSADTPLNFSGEVLADIYLGNDPAIKAINKDLAARPIWRFPSAAVLSPVARRPSSPISCARSVRSSKRRSVRARRSSGRPTPSVGAAPAG
jgi:ABC-type phosphate transport system substrate-binding protein